MQANSVSSVISQEMVAKLYVSTTCFHTFPFLDHHPCTITLTDGREKTVKLLRSEINLLSEALSQLPSIEIINNNDKSHFVVKKLENQSVDKMLTDIFNSRNYW